MYDDERLPARDRGASRRLNGVECSTATGRFRRGQGDEATPIAAAREFTTRTAGPISRATAAAVL